MNTAEIATCLEVCGLSVGGALIPPPAVRPEALIPVCDDYLKGVLSCDDLQQIAACLLERKDRAANQDTCETECDYPDRVERVLVEWHAPEIYFPMSSANVELLRSFLSGDEWKPMTRA